MLQSTYMGSYIIKKLKDKNHNVEILEDSTKVYMQAKFSDWSNETDQGELRHITGSCF